MTPTNEQADRIKGLVAHLRSEAGPIPLLTTCEVAMADAANELEAFLSAIAALQTRAEDAERERDAAVENLRLYEDANSTAAVLLEQEKAIMSAEFLLALIAAALANTKANAFTAKDGLRWVHAYHLAEAEARAIAAETRAGELEGALKPFADEADTWSRDALENLLPVYIAQSKSGSTFMATFSLADIARARASLTPPLELGK